jgi:hypothetical protein
MQVECAFDFGGYYGLPVLVAHVCECTVLKGLAFRLWREREVCLEHHGSLKYPGNGFFASLNPL